MKRLAAWLYVRIKRLRWWLILDVAGELGRPGHDEALLLRWQNRLLAYAPAECVKHYQAESKKEEAGCRPTTE